ncbi:MAG: aminopeptidase [Cytophagales bacterium]|nr:MAG: aminopeptidase [Cytophagales bacterium]
MFDLLHQLCQVHAPSGNEVLMKLFLLDYIEQNSYQWKVKPQVVQGVEFQDALVLVFGKPRTAIFAHIDSIGFMVRYENELIPIGGPEAKIGYQLRGRDTKGEILCSIDQEEDHHITYAFDRNIERGTELTFDCDFRLDEEYVQSCYLDNRLGVWNALRVAETLEDGIIAFSCWEEHGGGSVSVIAKYIYEKYGVQQALISDITWITKGVHHGKGAAISIRDRSIPRRNFVNTIIQLVAQENIPYQLEVEAYGGSDGKDLQSSPYPFDWCFIGAAEANVHSPDEKVHLADIDSMLKIYQLLMKKL